MGITISADQYHKLFHQNKGVQVNFDPSIVQEFDAEKNLIKDEVMLKSVIDANLELFGEGGLASLTESTDKVMVATLKTKELDSAYLDNGKVISILTPDFINVEIRGDNVNFSIHFLTQDFIKGIRSPVDFAERYEQMREGISNMRISDEGKQLLIDELDKEFVKHSSAALLSQSIDAGLSVESSRRIGSDFAKNYLKLRGDGEITSALSIVQSVISKMSKEWPYLSILLQ